MCYHNFPQALFLLDSAHVNHIEINPIRTYLLKESQFLDKIWSSMIFTNPLRTPAACKILYLVCGSMHNWNTYAFCAHCGLNTPKYFKRAVCLFYLGANCEHVSLIMFTLSYEKLTLVTRACLRKSLYMFTRVHSSLIC